MRPPTSLPNNLMFIPSWSLLTPSPSLFLVLPSDFTLSGLPEERSVGGRTNNGWFIGPKAKRSLGLPNKRKRRAHLACRAPGPQGSVDAKGYGPALPPPLRRRCERHAGRGLPAGGRAAGGAKRPADEARTGTRKSVKRGLKLSNPESNILQKEIPLERVCLAGSYVLIEESGCPWPLRLAHAYAGLGVSELSGVQVPGAPNTNRALHFYSLAAKQGRRNCKGIPPCFP